MDKKINSVILGSEFNINNLNIQPPYEPKSYNNKSSSQLNANIKYLNKNT